MLESGDIVKVSKSVNFPRFPEGTIGVIASISASHSKPYMIRTRCADGYPLSSAWNYSADELEFVSKAFQKPNIEK